MNETEMIKRLNELEAISVIQEKKLGAIEVSLQKLLDSTDKIMAIVNSTSIQMEFTSKRLEENTDKMANEHDTIIQLRMAHAQQTVTIDILTKDLLDLKTRFLEQIQNCQYSFKNNTDLINSMKNEHDIFIQKTGQSIDELYEDNTDMKSNIDTISAKLAEMEKIREGWKALRIMAGATIAAVSAALIIREAYLAFVK